MQTENLALQSHKVVNGHIHLTFCTFDVPFMFFPTPSTDVATAFSLTDLAKFYATAAAISFERDGDG